MLKSLLIATALFVTPVPSYSTELAQATTAPTCIDAAQNAKDAANLGATLDLTLTGEKLYIFWDYVAKKFNADRAQLATIEMVEFYLLADGNILVIMYQNGCSVNGFTMPYDVYIQQQEEAFGQEV